MKKEKTYEEKLWNWLLKNLGMDARKVYDYVIRLNKKPRRIEFFKNSKFIKPRF